MVRRQHVLLLLAILAAATLWLSGRAADGGVPSELSQTEAPAPPVSAPAAIAAAPLPAAADAAPALSSQQHARVTVDRVRPAVRRLLRSPSSSPGYLHTFNLLI